MKQASLFLIVFTLAVVAMADTFTARLLLKSGETKPVRDCVLFMPFLGKETPVIKENLQKLGYNPQDTNDIYVEAEKFVNQDGYPVTKFKTLFRERIGYYGKGTIILTMDGYIFEKSKKRISILRMHRLGMDKNKDAVASSSFVGILSEQQFSLNELPKCSSY